MQSLHPSVSQRGRAWRLSAALAVCSLILSACGAAGGGGGGAVRVASVLSGQAGYLTGLIKELGLDQKHHVNLQVMDLGLVESANALRQGRADVAIMSPSAMLRLKTEQHFDSVVVGPFNWSGNAWVVREDAPYQEFSDLKGERIGNFPRTTGAYFFSSILANDQKLDIEKDFKPVDADVAALVGLLGKGEVKAANLFEPHVSKMVATGDYRVLVDFDKSFQSVMGAKPLKSVYAASDKWVKTNRDSADAVQAMFADALEKIRAGKDRKYFNAHAEEMFGLTSDAQVKAGYDRNRETVVDPNTWDHKEQIQTQNRILERGVELGMLPEPPDGWQTSLWMDCYFDCGGH